MRERTTTTGSFSTLNERKFYTRANCTAGFTQTSTSSTYSGHVKTKLIRDVEVPRFHFLLRCGKFLPINPVEIITTEETRIAGSGDHNTSSVSPPCIRAYASGPGWGLVPWSISVPAPQTSIIDSVVNAAIANAKSAVWDGLTFMGELKETREYFGTVAKRFERMSYSAAGKANKLARKSRKNPFDVFSNLWLEYRYAIRPMIFDFQNICNTLVKKIENGSLVEGHSSQTETLNDAKTTVTVGTPAAGTGTIVDTLNGTRRYNGFAYAGIKSEGLTHVGFDPLSTAYELTRWSFVLDWFIDVNSWLKSISPFTGADLLGSGYSIKDDYTLRQEISRVWSGTTSGLVESGTFSGLSTEIVVKGYTRSPQGVSGPSWNPRLNTVRWVDLASLLYGVSKNTRRILLGR